MKKGDKVIVKIDGKEIKSVLASDPKDGTVVIKQSGTFSPVSTSKVRLDPDAQGEEAQGEEAKA